MATTNVATTSLAAKGQICPFGGYRGSNPGPPVPKTGIIPLDHIRRKMLHGSMQVTIRDSNPSYTSRESNPGRMNGNHPCCHYTTSVCLLCHKGRLENRRFELLTSRMQSEHSTTELIPHMETRSVTKKNDSCVVVILTGLEPATPRCLRSIEV